MLKMKKKILREINGWEKLPNFARLRRGKLPISRKVNTFRCRRRDREIGCAVPFNYSDHAAARTRRRWSESAYLVNVYWAVLRQHARSDWIRLNIRTPSELLGCNLRTVWQHDQICVARSKLSYRTRWGRLILHLPVSLFSAQHAIRFRISRLISWPTFTILSLPLCLECYNCP